jgi:hypothetical protein
VVAAALYDVIISMVSLFLVFSEGVVMSDKTSVSPLGLEFEVRNRLRRRKGQWAAIAAAVGPPVNGQWIIKMMRDDGPDRGVRKFQALYDYLVDLDKTEGW